MRSDIFTYNPKLLGVYNFWNERWLFADDGIEVWTYAEERSSEPIADISLLLLKPRYGKALFQNKLSLFCFYEIAKLLFAAYLEFWIYALRTLKIMAVSFPNNQPVSKKKP